MQPADVRDGPTRQLARRALNIGYADLDRATIEHTKLLLLDQLGCLLVGSILPWTKIVYRYMTSFGGAPQARVVNYGDKIAVQDAAYVNSVFSQGCEWDDFTTRGMGAGHGGAGSWPVALALGEYLHASGKDLLVAGIVGYECMARVGKAVRPFSGPGGHPVHGILSPIGSVAVSGWLLRLSEQEMTMAFSIAASHAAGLNEYSYMGGEVKRLHAGTGARGGIQSAFLGQLGFTGPPTALEGEAGLVRTFGAKPKIEEIDKPSDEFAVMESGPKVYPTPGVAATCIECMTELRKRKGFKHDAIESIDVAISKWSQEHAGQIFAPTDCASAQYSIPYSIALQAVIGRNDLDDYMNGALWNDPRIVDVSNRVKFRPNAEAEGDARHACRMTVTLKDGTTCETLRLHPRGSFLDPLSPDDYREKFTSLAERVVGRARTQELIQVVSDIESMHDITDLMDLICKR